MGADEHIYAFHVDSLQWLADTDLLEMLVDKLSPPVLSSCTMRCSVLAVVVRGAVDRQGGWLHMKWMSVGVGWSSHVL